MGAFLVFSLLTERSVLLLPFFFFVGLAEAPEPDTSRPPIRQVPLYLLFLASFCCSALIAHWRDPASATAGYACLLRPLLGSRWLANGIWLALMLGLVSFRPPHLLRVLARPILPRRVSGLRAVSGVFLFFWLILVTQALIYRWGLPGQEILGQYLLAASLPVLAGVAVVFALATSGKKTAAWILVGLVAWAATWALLRTPALEPRAGSGPQPESVFSAVRSNDLLLIRQDALRQEQIRVPGVLARRGNIQTFASYERLEARLCNPEITTSHGAIWVLDTGQSDLPWLPLFTPDQYKPMATGTGPDPLLLHRFDRNEFPRPITLLSRNGPSAEVTATEGLHDDGVWTGPEFRMIFDLPVTSATHLDFYRRDWRPAPLKETPPDLRVILNGRELEMDRIEKTYLSFRIPPATLREKGNSLLLEVATFVPAELDSLSTDRRRLGLGLDRMVLR